MTWAKISDGFGDDPTMLGLSRGHRLLWVELTVWSCKHETDGALPGHVVTRVTDEPDAAAGIAALVDAGLLEPTDGGYALVAFLDDQRAREDIVKARARNAARQHRQRAHQGGDHTTCDPRWCRNAVTPPVTDGVSNVAPTRPDPTRSQTGSGGSGTTRRPRRRSEPRPATRVTIIDTGKESGSSS